MFFFLPEAREILARHGAHLEGETAYFTPALIEKHISLAPSRFIRLARNPERSVLIGGGQVVFAPVYGPPFGYGGLGWRQAGSAQPGAAW